MAALVVGAGVNKPAAVEEILLSTARKPAGRNAAAGARVDDHYGAGIVDAAAALHKARDARGGEELGLGLAAGLLGLVLTRRRGIAVGKLGLGALAAFVVGASGLDLTWAIPLSWSHAHAVAGVLSGGYTDLSAGPLSATLVYSAAVPVLLTLLLYGVRRLRPALAGFGFGVAGALLFAAIAHTVDLRFVPDALEPYLARRPGGDRRPVRDGLPAQGVTGRRRGSVGTAARVGGQRELAGDLLAGRKAGRIRPDRLVADREERATGGAARRSRRASNRPAGRAGGNRGARREG